MKTRKMDKAIIFVIIDLFFLGLCITMITYSKLDILGMIITSVIGIGMCFKLHYHIGCVGND